MNLSHHIPQNNDWLKAKMYEMGVPQFMEYSNRVYKLLLDLQPGCFINIANTKAVSEQNRELFIKCCCLFFTEKGNPFTGYEFSADATKITRREPIVFKPSMWHKQSKKSA